MELENFFFSIAINIPRRWRFPMHTPQIRHSQQGSGCQILLDFVGASSEELKAHYTMANGVAPCHYPKTRQLTGSRRQTE
jgi:hypothetical protein